MKKLLRLLIPTPVIVKKFFLIVIRGIKKLWGKSTAAKWLMSIILILLTTGGSYGIWKYYHRDDEISLSQAARIGEVTTHKLMVQIENPKGNAADAGGRYERGDIILIKPGDFSFSDAEKESFLILHMDLTDKQAEVLVRALEKKTKLKDETGRRITEETKRRKYSIDLNKVDIGNEAQKGREMDGMVYTWDVIDEKN